MKKKKNTKLFEWQNKCKEAKCEKCGESKLITVDHIISGSIIQLITAEHFEQDLVYEWEDNFQFLCKYCNFLKGNRLDYRNPKTAELLKKLVDSTLHHRKLIK